MSCKHCLGLGYDVGGYRCTCRNIEPFPWEWVLIVFIVIILIKIFGVET